MSSDKPGWKTNMDLRGWYSTKHAECLDDVGRLDIPTTVLPCTPGYYKRLVEIADANFRNVAEVFHAAKRRHHDPTHLDPALTKQQFRQAAYLHDMYFDTTLAARAARDAADEYAEQLTDADGEGYEALRRAIARLIEQEAKAAVALLALS